MLPEVDIVVHAAELIEYEDPEIRFRVTVSAGTYVRALARDLGERLGIGAHLTALRREAIGEISVQDAIPLEALDPGIPLLPPQAVLGHLPKVQVTEAQAAALGFGQLVPGAGDGSGGHAMAVAPGERLVAIGICREDGFHPNVVLETNA